MRQGDVCWAARLPRRWARFAELTWSDPRAPRLAGSRLLESLMADAIGVVLGRVAATPLEYKATIKWIRSGRRGEISFDDACFWLRLCPERSRRALLAAARGLVPHDG